MKFPSVSALEELYPDLIRFAAYSKSDESDESDAKTQQNFTKAMNTAARLWTIKRSLYEPDSDIYVEIDSPSFKCATWEKLFADKVPDYRQKTLSEFLLRDFNPNDCDAWKNSVVERYNLDDSLLDGLLSSPIFTVDPRTIRNHFKRLSKLRQPVLFKSTESRGEYIKLSAIEIEEYESKVNSIIEYGSNEALNLINDELFTIADLLLRKIEGEQRLFIHTEYIVNQELQDRADDWANDLKEIWSETPIPPIVIEYDSASSRTTAEYIVYPVCLYYHQRAFYLCAYGQRPNYSSKFGWYNYRLERIIDLYSSSWDDSEITKELKTATHDRDKVKPEYQPEHIQLELDSAYGFDFYHDRATMLLRFNADFYDRYIQNTDRHPTFKRVDIEAAKSFIDRQLKTDTNLTTAQKQQLTTILERNTEDAFYLLDYRVGDNNVIMRLRTWCPNVEVIYPWSLRQRMREDMELTWRLYESDE